MESCRGLRCNSPLATPDNQEWFRLLPGKFANLTVFGSVQVGPERDGHKHVSMTMKVKGTENAHKLFQYKLSGPHQTLTVPPPPRKEFMCVVSWE